MSISELEEGDVVVLRSGGRPWTLDNLICLPPAYENHARLVSMSEGGLMQEVIVKVSSILKAR